MLNGEKVFISFFNKFDGAVTLMKGEPDEKGKTPFMTFMVTKDLAGVTEIPQFREAGDPQPRTVGFSPAGGKVPAIAWLDADFGRTMSKFNHNRPLVVLHVLAGARSMLDFTHARLAEGGLKIDYARLPRLARRRRGQVDPDGGAVGSGLGHGDAGQVARTPDGQVHPPHGYRVEASVAKALGGKVVRQINEGCLEILGPEGVSEEYLAEKWFRDVRIADIYEGRGEIQRILITRALLGYKNELN